MNNSPEDILNDYQRITKQVVLRMFKRLRHQWNNNPELRSEIWQEAAIATVEAIKTHNPEKAQLRTWVNLKIFYCIHHFIRKKRKIWENEISYGDMDTKGFSAEDVEDNVLNDQLRPEGGTDRIIYDKLINGDYHSFELEEELGISASHIRNKKKKLLDNIKDFIEGDNKE